MQQIGHHRGEGPQYTPLEGAQIVGAWSLKAVSIAVTALAITCVAALFTPLDLPGLLGIARDSVLAVGAVSGLLAGSVLSAGVVGLSLFEGLPLGDQRYRSHFRRLSLEVFGVSAAVFVASCVFGANPLVTLPPATVSGQDVLACVGTAWATVGALGASLTHLRLPKHDHGLGEQ